jgi:hypothetical protein
MPSAPRPIQTLVDTLLAVKKHGGVATAARKLGVKYSGFQSRHRDALAAIKGGQLKWRKNGTIEIVNAPMRPGESLVHDVLLRNLREDVKRYRKAYETTVAAQQEEERLLEMFQTSIRAIPVPSGRALSTPPAKRAPSSASGHREVPLLVIGDQQIGEEIAIEETGGINAYNFGVFQQRLEYLEERVLDILHHHQKAEFPELVVFLMGDNISGRIHEELQKYGHQHVIDQVYLGALTTALFLYRIQRFGRFQRIRVSCVSGNHGRLDKAKESKRYYKNFDYLFHSIVATTLKGVPAIEMFIPKSLFTVVDVAGVRILQSHGHELPPSSLGIPLYSVNRASAGYQELLSWSEAKRFDYWVLAHFHRPMELDGAIVNGTMAGLSEYGIGKFKPIRPMQKLIGFHGKYGKAWEYPVRLDFAPKTPKIYTFDAEMATPDAVALFGARQAQTNRDTRASGRRKGGGHA